MQKSSLEKIKDKEAKVKRFWEQRRWDAYVTSRIKDDGERKKRRDEIVRKHELKKPEFRIFNRQRWEELCQQIDYTHKSRGYYD